MNNTNISNINRCYYAIKEIEAATKHVLAALDQIQATDFSDPEVRWETQHGTYMTMECAELEAAMEDLTHNLYTIDSIGGIRGADRGRADWETHYYPEAIPTNKEKSNQ